VWARCRSNVEQDRRRAEVRFACDCPPRKARERQGKEGTEA